MVASNAKKPPTADELWNAAERAAWKPLEPMLPSEWGEHYADVIRKRWAEMVHGEGCDWQSLTPAAPGKSL